jgi:hypothetical protein
LDHGKGGSDDEEDMIVDGTPAIYDSVFNVGGEDVVDNNDDHYTTLI